MTTPESPFPEVVRYPSRDNVDYIARNLPEDRPRPIDPPQVERMWDKTKAVPARFLDVHWRDYCGRYIPESAGLSLFDRLFGSQQKLAESASAKSHMHPCH